MCLDLVGTVPGSLSIRTVRGHPVFVRSHRVRLDPIAPTTAGGCARISWTGIDIDGRGSSARKAVRALRFFLGSSRKFGEIDDGHDAAPQLGHGSKKRVCVVIPNRCARRCTRRRIRSYVPTPCSTSSSRRNLTIALSLGESGGIVVGGHFTTGAHCTHCGGQDDDMHS